MVNQEIIEGLKRGLEKGQTLEKSMMSLYNSGYTKDEIEEAAGYLYAQGLIPPKQPIQPPVAQAQPSQKQQVQQQPQQHLPTQPLLTQAQPPREIPPTLPIHLSDKIPKQPLTTGQQPEQTPSTLPSPTQIQLSKSQIPLRPKPVTPFVPVESVSKPKSLTPIAKTQQTFKPKPLTPQTPIKRTPQVKPRVSIYGEPPIKEGSQALLLVLVFILFLLLGTLVGIFIFQPEISEFINRVFDI